MTLGTVILTFFYRKLADADRRHVPLKAADPAAVSLTEDVPPAESKLSAIDQVPEATRITALLVIYGIVIVFWMVFHQNGSTMTYWADENTAWNVSGVVSNAINPFWIVALSIPLVNVWNWLRKRGLEPSTPGKMALGMLLTSLAFLILFVAAKSGGDQTFVTDAQGQFVLDEHGEFKAIQHRVSPLWLIAAYMVISLGELMLSPMGLSLVSKVAPARMRGLMMGGWFVATAIGNKLTVIGMLWTQVVSLVVLAALLAAWPWAWRSCCSCSCGRSRRRCRVSEAQFDGLLHLSRNETMRLFLAILIMMMAASPLWAAGRPMTVDDLLGVKGVADPQLSPDGTLVVYVVSELDRATDKNNSSLWLVPAAGRPAQTIDDRAGRQQPPSLEPRRQDDRVRLAPERLGPGLALADRRRRAAPAHQAADRRLGPHLVAQGRQARLHRRGLSRARLPSRPPPKTRKRKPPRKRFASMIA